MISIHLKCIILLLGLTSHSAYFPTRLNVTRSYVLIKFKFNLICYSTQGNSALWATRSKVTLLKVTRQIVLGQKFLDHECARGLNQFKREEKNNKYFLTFSWPESRSFLSSLRRWQSPILRSVPCSKP